MSQHTQRQAIRQCRENLASILFRRAALGLCFRVILALGLLAFTLRMLWQVDPLWLAGGLLLLLPTLLYAKSIARRQMPSDDQIVALLDYESRAGGMLMAESTFPENSWAGPALAVIQPKIDWRRGPEATARLLPASLFLLIALLLPDGFLHPDPNRRSGPMDISESRNQLAEQVEQLKELQLIDQEQAKFILETIEKIAAESRSDDPAKTLEALANLRQELDQLGEQALAELPEQIQSLQELEALAEMLKNLDPDGLSPELRQALEDLLREQIADASDRLGESIGDELNDLLQQLAGQPNGDGADLFDPELLDRLARMAQMDAQELREAFERIAEMHMRPEDAAQAIEAMGGGCDGEGIEAAIAGLPEGWAENADEAMANLMQIVQNHLAGISRGPGLAPMTWKDPSNHEGVEFKTQTISPLAVNPDASELIGISLGDPTSPDAASAVVEGGPAIGPGREGTASRAAVLPQHRRAVERFFAGRTEAPEP